MAVWLSGNALISTNVRCATPGPVRTRMGNRLRAGKPSSCITSQISLAIPPGRRIEYQRKLGANGHDTLALYSWYRSVSWCLAEGYSSSLSGPTWLGKGFTFVHFTSCSSRTYKNKLINIFNYRRHIF